MKPRPRLPDSADALGATAPDPFAAALEQFSRTGHALLRFVRSDGRRGKEDAWWYFTSYANFPSFEKRALRYARGRVLDVGCGVGRHARYLGHKGLGVVGMEQSVRVAAIARARGVKDVRLASACGTLPFEANEFDTFLLLGNNLGICGDRAGTLHLLSELERIARPHARVICSSRAPDLTDKRDLAYWKRRITEGAHLGEMEMDLEFRREQARVRLYLVSPAELMRLGNESEWELTRVFVEERAEEGYAAVLEKC